jgi:tRNA threonylcarbamoyladenosine biosynthesis protein TsaB
MARHGQQNISQPIILALELSTMCGSIAIVCPQLCIYEQSLYSTSTHSKRLINQIDTALSESALGWDDIGAIAVSLGPGSFTGLRIALGTVKGLTMALDKKMIGISTLAALARQMPRISQQIRPILDARKKEVYTALYKYTDNGLLQQLCKPQVLSPEALISLIEEPTFFIGDGISVYKTIIADNLGSLAQFAPPEIYFPRAASVGMLALDKFLQSDFLDPAKAAPMYVRASDAELNFGS